jgi:DNA modification methylase
VIRFHEGDCLDVMKSLRAAGTRVDAIVTDPPAGISFMGKEWDHHRGGRDSWVAWMQEAAALALDLTKPGGHALVWAIPRTSHWTATAWEDAGWEVRDRVAHLFGTGFPKNRNALKPAMEDWWLLRKPLEGTVAANVMEHGTGALNIEGCRIGTTRGVPASLSKCKTPNGVYGDYGGGQERELDPNVGRWPANVIHDGSDEVLEAFAAFGTSASKSGGKAGSTVLGVMNDDAWRPRETPRGGHNDTGTAARFFKSCGPSEDEVLNSTLVWLLWQSNVDIIIGDSNGADTCLSETAPHAGAHSPLSHQTTGGIAPSDATGWGSGKSGPGANSAASPSGSCETPTVQSPARARIRIGSDLKGLFTSATASELRKLSETLIAAIQSIESACSHGSLPTKLSLTLSHVKCAAIREQTGITTITISHWRSDGCAEPVTFSITPKNSAPGAAGSASRFIYSAKASKADRAGSAHPTVKPISLLRYLCRLVTPPGGLILDPFAGSGTTLEAAALEGFRCIGIEIDPASAADIRRRMAVVRDRLGLFAPAMAAE